MEALINDRPRAEIALEKYFGPLYAIEQQCRDEELSYDEVTERRQEFSLPLLNDFFLWLEQQLPLTIPNTPIHKAISYSLTRKKQLMVYITDGIFAIDNNFIENQVRPIALGRRNMLFAGSHQGGRRAAVIYSLLGTCKLQKINASEWLGDVLRRITIHPADKLSALLPQNWKPLPENTVQTAHAEPAVATA